jgi:adenine-specific DNA-methyltransferase
MNARAESANVLQSKANYYQHLGDCRELIEALPPDSIDLIVTSPPYFMGKEYDYSRSKEDFTAELNEVLPSLVRVLRSGGSMCWQVGYHIKEGVVTPLDYLIHSAASSIKDINLRNRIVWTFGHGLHGRKKFSGRHEMILWYTKGDEYHFDLDSVRVPQKYPGKRYYKGENKGKLSGNPLGKNPSDVWQIPNVKARHVEKTDHPCQFPVALAQRLVLALSPCEGIVLDPFAGSATTGVAAIIEGRRYLGADIEANYHEIALARLNQAVAGTVKHRPLNKPIFKPHDGLAVAQKPSNFA